MQTHATRWIQAGEVKLAEELDTLGFEIAAHCFLGLTDPATVGKLRTIAAGASLYDVSGDPAVSAAVRDALMEMVDEEMEAENKLVDGQTALDFMLEGEMDMEDMKIELCHFLIAGRDGLARAL